jgi:hypothetical protein
MTLPSRRDFLVSALTATFAKPLLAAPLASPVSHEGGVTARRALLLNRGVNLSGWYGGWGEYSPAHLSTWTTPADLAFIRAAGLQYVRLCIDPVQLTAGGFDSADSTAALARLDKSIDDILAVGLGLSITVFPKSDYKQALLTPDGAGAFLTLWKFLATHFASRNPDRVFFDLLNEPEIDDAVRWNALQARVVEAIRSIDQQHTRDRRAAADLPLARQERGLHLPLLRALPFHPPGSCVDAIGPGAPQACSLSRRSGETWSHGRKRERSGSARRAGGLRRWSLGSNDHPAAAETGAHLGGRARRDRHL